MAVTRANTQATTEQHMGCSGAPVDKHLIPLQGPQKVAGRVYECRPELQAMLVAYVAFVVVRGRQAKQVLQGCGERRRGLGLR